MSEITERFTTAGGEELRKIEYEDQYGNTQERWQTTGKNNEFRTAEQVQQLKEQTRQRPDARRKAVKQAFPEIENTQGLNPDKAQAGQKRNNIIKSLMQNVGLQNDVRNNPLIEGKREQTQAIEARARQVLKEFEQADSEAEKARIKRQYNLTSN